MNKKNLCSTCKTGLAALQLDESSPFCPYINCHNGETCSLYEPLTKEEQALPEGKKL